MAAAQKPSCSRQKAEFHPTCSFVHCCRSRGLAGTVEAPAKWLLCSSLSFAPHLELLARSSTEGRRASRSQCLGFSSAHPSLCRSHSLAIVTGASWLGQLLRSQALSHVRGDFIPKVLLLKEHCGSSILHGPLSNVH